MENFHEKPKSAKVIPVKEASDRSFAFMISAVLMLVGFYPLMDGGQVYLEIVFVALLVALIGLFFPTWLRPIKTVWLIFGRLMHKVISPVILAILYIAVIFPIGMTKRLFGWDPLRRKRCSEKNTYWIERSSVLPNSQDFRKQF